MTDWEHVFYVAIVCFSGVFAGLILLQVSTNIIRRIVALVERTGGQDKKA